MGDYKDMPTCDADGCAEPGVYHAVDAGANLCLAHSHFTGSFVPLKEKRMPIPSLEQTKADVRALRLAIEASR